MKQRKQEMSGDNPETKIAASTKDRFDMEQEILECWKVTDDIAHYVETDSDKEQWVALRGYYEKKFDRLWNTFERLIQQGNLK